MTTTSPLTRSRRRGLALCLSAALALGAGFAAPATADPLDTLMDDLSSISHAAEELTEQTKQLDEDVAAAEAAHDAAVEDHRVADERLAAAEATLADNQDAVDAVAVARYNGARTDPLTAIFGATSPQRTIERSSFLAMVNHATEKVTSANIDARTAAEEHRAATLAAQSDAERALAQLDATRDELQRSQDELDVRTSEVRSRIDSLSPEERSRWESRYGAVATEAQQALFGSVSSSAALQAALTKIGSPYSWGAAGEQSFDCSGLMYWAYQQQGKTIPRTSQAQVSGGTPVDRSELMPGDIVAFYPGATHVGMYAGNGMIVHASDYGIPVQVVSLDSMPYHGAARY